MFYAVNIRKILKTSIALILIMLAGYIFVSTANKYFPLKFINYVNEFSAKYNLEPALVYAVINAESRFNPSAISRKDARGLMQIIEGTAGWGAEEIGIPEYNYDRIHEPRVNIEIGCWYLSRLLRQYSGDLRLALAAYNAGSGNVAKWLQNENYSSDGIILDYIPFPETRNYVEKVKLYIKIYEMRLKLQDLL